MDETAKHRKMKKLVMERLRKVAQGQPIGRPPKEAKRQPWQKLGKHNGTPYFEVQCDGCGRTHYFQLRKEHGVWSWRPYFPFGRRRVIVTKPLVEELITQRLKGLSKSKLEEILDEFTHDGTDDNGTNPGTGE